MYAAGAYGKRRETVVVVSGQIMMRWWMGKRIALRQGVDRLDARAHHDEALGQLEGGREVLIGAKREEAVGGGAVEGCLMLDG